jgi:hypothetical protein
MEESADSDELPIDAAERIDISFLRSGIANIKAGIKPTENEMQVIEDEMGLIEDILSHDQSERQQYYCAMAWLGLLTKYGTPGEASDPDVVSTGRKPRKIKIDGIEYERW